MKKILVPTDFSENSVNAVEYAVQIALAMRYRIVLLHIVQEGANTDEHEQKLAAICKALTDSFPNLACNSKITSGRDIPGEIVKASALFNAELIVMGTQGVANFEKILFGSNTAAVIEKSTCTVLSIPRNSAFIKPTRILFATTLERHDINAALKIVGLAKPFNADLVIAHVLTHPDPDEIERSKLEIFTRDVTVLSDYPRISCRMARENTVAMGLDTLLENTNADVIALTTHQRGLFEKIINPSITRKFAERSSIPLIAFHS